MSLSTYPFPLFFEEWNQNPCDVTKSLGTIKAILSLEMMYGLDLKLSLWQVLQLVMAL